MTPHIDSPNRFKRTPKMGFWRLPISLGAMLLLSAGSAPAQQINVTVNGEPVKFSGLGPQQIAGRTLVPVRGVLEKLGAEVAWIPQTRSVIASNGKIDIQLHLGDRHALVNGKDVLMDVAAQEIAGHTMVPLRFIGEALGADVGWDGPTRTVIIATSDAGKTQNQNPALHRSPITPAAPAPTRPALTPAINNFAHNAKGWLRQGQALNVAMDGTPGGQASFRIPGLVDSVPMREESPGHYVGSWAVPNNKPIQLTNAAVIGSLQIGDRIAPLLQAGETVSVDAIAPKIRDRSPDPDSHVTGPQPNISAVFEDQGSGIDRDSIRLLINKRDVTSDATVTRDFITYKPGTPLEAGPQTVQLIAADRAGNRVETNWTFIEDKRASGGIRSVTDNANKTLEPGDVLHVEMNGSPGGNAAFTLGSIKDVKMAEAMPGHYVADYTIRKGDDISRASVAVRLTTTDGEKFVQQSERVVSVNTGKPIEPVITSPSAKGDIVNPLVIKGKATPNTRVHVKVDYRNKIFGLVSVQGTAADVVVTADKNGNWQTDPINLNNLLSNKSVEYTISATSTNAANQTSDTTAFRFHLR
jgi:hypothetical protein